MVTGDQKKVCIVTSAPVSHNPRVLKEADALCAAGFKVVVIATLHDSALMDWNLSIMKGRPWSLKTIEWGLTGVGMRFRRYKSGARQRLFRSLALTFGLRSRIPDLAFCRLYSEMLASAVAERADLYIAHNPQALPVACRAAELMRVKAAFDSEDYHLGEFQPSEEETLAYKLIANLESRYLPECAYVTAPSEGISETMAKRYKLQRTAVVRNVFPLADRDGIDNRVIDRRGDSLSLYWYSQVIGMNRGLQDVIMAASLLTKPVQIHIRGVGTDDVKRALLDLPKKNGFKVDIFFHDTVHPNELLSRAAEHDVGLALEQNVCENRRITVTNKFYFYALAGLAIAATNTKGQRSEIDRHPEVGFAYEPDKYAELAKHLQRYIDDPALLERAKRASLTAAQSELNWGMESRILVDLVGSILGIRYP